MTPRQIAFRRLLLIPYMAAAITALAGALVCVIAAGGAVGREWFGIASIGFSVAAVAFAFAGVAGLDAARGEGGG